MIPWSGEVVVTLEEVYKRYLRDPWTSAEPIFYIGVQGTETVIMTVELETGGTVLKFTDKETNEKVEEYTNTIKQRYYSELHGEGSE